MDGAGRSGEAVDIQKWWGSKGGTECSAWIFGQAAERGGGLRRAGAGPAAPPGPVRAGRRRIRGFLENSEKFFEFF